MKKLCKYSFELSKQTDLKLKESLKFFKTQSNCSNLEKKTKDIGFNYVVIEIHKPSFIYCKCNIQTVRKNGKKK